MITIDQGGAALPYLTLRLLRDSRGAGVLTWIQRGAPRHGSERWRVVPDTHPHLIVHRWKDGATRTAFVGARSGFVDVTQGERAFTVGLRLRPGTLAAVLGASAWELRDRSVSLNDARHVGVATRRAAVATCEGLRAVDDEADAACIELRLLQWLRAVEPLAEVSWQAQAFARRLRGARRVASFSVRGVADSLGVSERALRERCREGIGLRPKEAHRIARLHDALARSIRGARDAESAIAAGFADQAHFIRDARALIGTTPAAFRGRAGSFNTREPAGP
jgi:AraC-like DNA-binding protein